MLPNCAEFIIAQQTIARIGATSVQINTVDMAGVAASRGHFVYFYAI